MVHILITYCDNVPYPSICLCCVWILVSWFLLCVPSIPGFTVEETFATIYRIVLEALTSALMYWMRVNVTPSSVHCEHHTQGTLLVDGIKQCKERWYNFAFEGFCLSVHLFVANKRLLYVFMANSRLCRVFFQKKNVRRCYSFFIVRWESIWFRCLRHFPLPRDVFSGKLHIIQPKQCI